jgi:hypothetical protein
MNAKRGGPIEDAQALAEECARGYGATMDPDDITVET